MRNTTFVVLAGVLCVCTGKAFSQPGSSNPYGVAGYISNTNLQTFGFPAGIDTYDWNNLRTDLAYEMVRPFHYWYRYFVPGGNYVQAWIDYDVKNQPEQWFTQEGYPTDTPWNVRRGCNMVLRRYWGYYLDRTGGNYVGQIGLPADMLPQWYVDDDGNHQQRFDAWVTANPGKIWLMGNEPEGFENVEDLGGQDALTDIEYTVFYHTYTSCIASQDADALFAPAAMPMTTSPTWAPHLTVESVIATWERILGIYAIQYSQEMPVDIWNIHIYAGHGCTDPEVHRSEFVSVIEDFRDFVDTTRGGIYENAPMIMTEFNGQYAEPVSAPENVIAFLHDFRDDLNNLWVRGVLSQWFWFVSNGGTSWPEVSILDGPSLSAVGEEYKAAAWHWEELKPPIDEHYGTLGEPFHSENHGLWNLLVWSDGAAGNTISVDENHIGYVTVTVDPGSPAFSETTLADEQHLSDLGTFSFLIGQGAGIELAFLADDAVDTGLFLGYQHGDNSTDGGQSAVVLRAEGGDSANTSVIDAHGGDTLATGLDFMSPHKMLFVVNGDHEIDFYLDSAADPLATLARLPLPNTDANQLRLGSNSAQALGGVRFKGTIDVSAYAVGDDILHADFSRVKIDYDKDGDVDQSDFGHFQTCLTGPGVLQENPDCFNTMLDNDNDVDGTDLTLFRSCMTGPGIPSDLACP